MTGPSPLDRLVAPAVATVITRRTWRGGRKETVKVHVAGGEASVWRQRGTGVELVERVVVAALRHLGNRSFELHVEGEEPWRLVPYGQCGCSSKLPGFNAATAHARAVALGAAPPSARPDPATAPSDAALVQRMHDAAQAQRPQ